MRLAWCALPALALAAAGCASGTKAGGQALPQPVVLTIANHGSDANDLAEYIAAVGRLSNGSIRLVLKNNWRPGDSNYDARTLADVRHGRVDLAKIAVRSYAGLGVEDLQALRAPFLVDSLGLEENVLRSTVPDRMLPTIRRLGVEGLAILPGELQHPFGLERSLLGPADYHGAVIGVTPSRVSRLTFERLGAAPRAYPPGQLPPWRFTGAELDLFTLGEGADYAVLGRSSVAGNVVFWPQAVTVVGNPSVLAKLTPSQRDIFRRAGREALAPAIARIRAEDRADVGVLCRRDQLAFVDASPSQLAALQRAVRPVYTRLGRDPLTRSLIDEIRGMHRHSTTAPPLRCPASQHRQESASLLDGAWEMTASRAQAPEIDAGHYRMVLRRGRVRSSFTSPGSSGWRTTGTFSVRGDEIRFRYADGGGAIYRWNLFRGTLTFRKAPGVAEPANPTFAPWARVGA